MRLALIVMAGCGFSHGMLPNASSDADVTGVDALDARSDASRDGSTVTPLLVHDFEDDLIGPYTNIYLAANDSVNHSSSVAHTGVKSAHCTSATPAEAQATLFFNFANRTRMYTSMWIQPTAGFPPSDYVMIIAFVDDPAGSAWNNIATVAIHPDMRVSVLNTATGTYHYSSAQLTTDAWHHIEVVVLVSSTGGRLALAIDGAPQFDLTGINTGSLQFHRILTGLVWQGAGADPTTLYLDDVRLE